MLDHSPPTGVIACPVCPRRDVPADAARCPNCGVDLAPLVRVLALQRRLAVPAPSTVPPAPAPHRGRGITIALVLLAVACLALGADVVMLRRERDASARRLAGVRGETPPTPSAPAIAAPTAGNPPEAGDGGSLLRLLQGGEDVTLTADGPRVVVSFGGDLFASGSDVLLRRGRRQLEMMAGRFPGGSTPLRVEVRGLTDARRLRTGAPWADNWSLGLARAARAAGVLRAAASGPLALSIQSDGDSPPAHGARRSVTLVVCRC